VGFWKLNDGSGGSAYNSKKSVGIGNNAVGSSSLWNSTLPQPGTYTWTKDGSYYSHEISLSGLGIGEYKVAFVDPYGCPDPVDNPLTSSKIIQATDQVAPDISAISNLTVNNDAGTCTYTIDLPAEVAALTPTIADASGCKYSVKWKVVTDYNLNLQEYDYGEGDTDYKILGAILGRSGTDGLNTVTVTTLQNVDVTSSKTYTITLNDNEPPVAIGRFDEPISMNLDATGKVIYTAKQFNKGSYDNCSDADKLIYQLSTDGGTTWNDSINFDCSAIGTAVSIKFRVTDEALNTTLAGGVINGLSVLDVTPPLFNQNSQALTPYCATYDAVGSVPASDSISLADLALTKYTDNCGVTRIRFKRTHATYAGGTDADWITVAGMVFNPAIKLKFYEGTTTVTFELADGKYPENDVAHEGQRNKTTQAIFTVTVLPKPKPGGSGGIK
jgi:hypothetical protein